MSTAREKFADANVWKKFHGWMTLSWILLIPLSVVLRESLVWVVVMSHLAIVYSALACWQAARAEVESGNSS